VLRRIVLIAFIAVLAPAASAQAAATVVRQADGTLQYTAGAEQTSLTLTQTATTLKLDQGFGGAGFGAIVPSNCSVSGTAMTCTTIPPRVSIFLGATADTVGPAEGTSLTVPLVVNGGAGDDELTGGFGRDQLFGGPGADRLDGGAEADTLDGGPDGDLLTGGPGADDLHGGDGFDAVTYAASLTPVSVSHDETADDGMPNEGDDVHSDVEDVRGTPGADTISLGPADDVIDAGAGDDVIDGGAGFDAYDAGPGNDTVNARDGNAERVDCGDGTDTATVDVVDRVVNCETVIASPALVADADGDGFAKGADCNDGDAAIHPGAVDTPDDGIDQDCSGADATVLDRDGDGFPRPLDCNDGNAAVHPGAREVPGNQVDENCDGRSDPFPYLGSPVARAFTVFPGRYTAITALAVEQVPAGATVEVRCGGRGCPYKRFHRHIKKRAKRLQLEPPFRHARLKPGARVEVRVTQAHTVGRDVVFVMQRRALPRIETLCLPPGKTEASAC
jgi:hypothetical protein